MAAKSKKRLSKIENKLLKLNKLQLNDVLCPICQSILIEPVTLPCYHDFCKTCFNGSVENNALCCPLCRLRIGSWLRIATKQKSVVNLQLWEFIRKKFNKEVETKLRGEDLNLKDEVCMPRLSEPGEIRQEYEAELKRLEMERRRLEQKHLQETELLVKKLQMEEEELNKRNLELLRKDEMLAKEVQESSSQDICSNSIHTRPKNKHHKLKTAKIDSFLIKKTAIAKAKHSPLLTDDNTSTDSSSPKIDMSFKLNGTSQSRHSPEMVPSYGTFLKSFLDKKLRNVAGLWNKENGGSKEISVINTREVEMETKEVNNMTKNIKKTVVQSLPVSLPYKGILQRKQSLLSKTKNAETDSVDSMRQELCFFKPIECTTPVSCKTGNNTPVKVPVLRQPSESTRVPPNTAPDRSQYLESLCHLRQFSLQHKLPSAFVIALKVLQVKTSNHTKQEVGLKLKLKKHTTNVCNGSLSSKGNVTNKNKANNQTTAHKSRSKTTLRRTRSMGSIPKHVNETTPKKAKVKDRKVCSDRKPYLRSDSKKYCNDKLLGALASVPEDAITNQKLKSVAKNLSSPLKNCDVKVILEEQLRIEKMIEQEKGDLELARRVDAEWNHSRQLRRSTVKRQVSMNYALRPAKKLKV